MLEGNEHEGSKENDGVALPIDEHSNGNGTFFREEIHLLMADGSL